MNFPEPQRASGMSLRAKAWMIRAFVVATIGLLCVIAGSFHPAFAFGIALVPSMLCVAAFMAGALRFPRFLSSVHSIEPVLYSAAGVGLVKRIIATPVWPVFVGVIPPPRPTDRTDFLDYIEHSTEGA